MPIALVSESSALPITIPQDKGMPAVFDAVRGRSCQIYGTWLLSTQQVSYLHNSRSYK